MSTGTVGLPPRVLRPGRVHLPLRFDAREGPPVRAEVTAMASYDEPLCPIRVGDHCSLCHPGASGPDSCGLVYLVMSEAPLREELLRRWCCWRAEQEPGTSSGGQ